jgi:phosphoglycerate dehydrogenase-like enzyme
LCLVSREQHVLVLIDAALPEDRAREIGAAVPGVELRVLPRFGAAIPPALLRDAEVIYTSVANFHPDDSPKLRWVQTDSATTEPVRSSPVMRSAIPVANVSGAYSVAVAECALGMLLALTRRITMGMRWQLERHWPTDYDPWAGEDLYGLTMGIVGYGSIGRQIARLAQALGMTVRACKRRPEVRRDDSYLLPGTGDPDGLIPQAWYGPDRLQEMLAQSDVAMLTLPSVPTTEGMIGAAELAALPCSAYVVNVGRGAVVDELALAAALAANKLAGAALDVFVEEPLPAESPLWALPNVLIMPHVGSWTRLQAHRACGVLLENLRRDRAGLPLVNVIDKQLLY